MSALRDTTGIDAIGIFASMDDHKFYLLQTWVFYYSHGINS